MVYLLSVLLLYSQAVSVTPEKAYNDAANALASCLNETTDAYERLRLAANVYAKELNHRRKVFDLGGRQTDLDLLLDQVRAQARVLEDRAEALVQAAKKYRKSTGYLPTEIKSIDGGTHD